MKRVRMDRDSADSTELFKAAPTLMSSVTTSTAIEIGVARATQIERTLKHPTGDDKTFLADLLKRASLMRQAPQ